MENQKQCVSVRLSTSDIRVIRRIAERLSVSYSSIIRFAIKTMLAKLGPLSDGKSAGIHLLPVFLEHGDELTRHFDLDTERLEQIVNQDAGASELVAHSDIELLAMQTVFPNYLHTRLESLLERSINETELNAGLRDYLYGKYGQQCCPDRGIAWQGCERDGP